MTRRVLLAFLFVFFTLLCIMPAHAADPVIITEGRGDYPLAGRLEYIVDREKKLTVNDVTAGKAAALFSTAPADRFEYGYSPCAIWLKVTLENRQSADQVLYFVINHPQMEKIFFYTINENGRPAIARRGLHYPYRQRDIEYRNVVQKFTVKAGRRAVWYVRCETTWMTFGVELWGTDTLLQTINREQIMFGMLYGFMLVMIAYSLLLYISIREKPYLYFVLSAVCYFLVLSSMNGHAYEYLWPGVPWMANEFYGIAILLSVSFFSLFVMNFLNSDRHYRFFDVAFKVIIGASAAGIVLAFFIDKAYIIPASLAVSLILIILCTAIGIIRTVQGYRPAYSFMLAFGIMSIGLLLAQLHGFSMLSRSPFTATGFQYGIMFAISLLPLGVNAKVNAFKKEKEDFLRTSLGEKEILLKEIHHRVKNNLSIISSLIYFQRKSAQDPAADSLLMNLQGRIQSMALIHQKLYNSDNLASIDFADYCRELTDEIIRSYKHLNRQIILRLDVMPVQMPVETVMPGGLIINELVVNSIKHAFPEGGPGEILIRFTRSGVDEFQLTVSDNGRGLPEGFDWRKSSSIGMMIIQSLTKQLGGSLSLHGSPGLTCSVTFPLQSNYQEKLT